MRLLVANGSVVTPSGVQDVNVLCEDGQIIALTNQTAGADEVVDASGQYVFPGFIDPHVHSRDPGMTEKEDFAHSTLGALTGGVTTVIEMPNAIPPVDSVAAFHDRRAHHEASAWVDFGLWGLSVGESNLHELAPMMAAGACAVKIFWGYALRRDTRQLVYNLSDFPESELLLPPDNGDVQRVFAEMAKTGGVLAAHCEDRDILAASECELGHPIETYDDLLAARPATAEAVSIAVGAQLSKTTGCRFHVVHMSSARGADVVRAAQAAGIAVTAESCPQYLTLCDGDYDRIGPMMKVYPPVRTQQDQDALWAAVNDGTISSIGSDHAPHLVEEKQQGFATQPAGGVGCETLAPLMLDATFSGRTTIERLAEIMSSETAKLYGLYPRKGAVQVGSDADLTIVDPDAERTISNAELVAKQPISAWDGVTVRGIATMAVLGGQVAMRDGRPVGERRGQFVPAQHGRSA